MQDGLGIATLLQRAREFKLGRFLRIEFTASVIAVAFTAGCATPLVQLNDSTRSSPARDVASVLSPHDIPYETIEKDGIAVSYNLSFSGGDHFSGYRLTLVFRNNSDVAQVVHPVVTLQESHGLLVRPYAYNTFVAEAAALAGTVVPPVPQNESANYYSTGTIRDTTTGNSYTYSGTTTSRPAGGFAAGFAQGSALGASIRAAKAKEEGRTMLRWADAYWLRDNYQLPPDSAASGVLFFPAASVGQMPLRLRVALAGRTYTFVSAVN